MIATTHAQSNAVARSGVTVQLLSTHIANGLYHELGSAEHEGSSYRYLLLYLSESDRFCVAVTCAQIRTLVSVWSQNFQTPKGVLSVNRRTKQVARDIVTQLTRYTRPPPHAE